MLQRKVTLCGFIRSVTLLIAKKPDPFKVFLQCIGRWIAENNPKRNIQYGIPKIPESKTNSNSKTNPL